MVVCVVSVKANKEIEKKRNEEKKKRKEEEREVVARVIT